MNKAKKYFWSDQINVSGDNLFGEKSRGSYIDEHKKRDVTTNATHINKAIEIAYYEGIRKMTGHSLMDIKSYFKNTLKGKNNQISFKSLNDWIDNKRRI